MEMGEITTRDKHEEGLEINIKDASTFEPTDIFITIIGPDSREWRRFFKEEMKKALEETKELSEEEELAKDIEVLVAVTKDWRGITRDGKPLEFTKELCTELYTKAPWLMDQINIAANRFRDFTKD